MVVQKSKHFLFHYLQRQFQMAHLKDGHLLVGVSGGVDSMTLLSVLLEIKKVLNLRVSVGHVHHGSENKVQLDFQNKSARTVKSFCEKNNVKFYCNKKMDEDKCLSDTFSGVKQTEADMRKYRYKLLAQFVKESKADYLALAHTADDLLETRLIRLIRGTGEQGLKSMSFKNKKMIRPFILLSRSQIKDYAEKRKLNWCEDPSNRSKEYSFRNWIRREWLPMLEKKRPGSLKAIARSLELMTQVAGKHQKNREVVYKSLIKNRSLRRDALLAFSKNADKKKILAYYMKEQGFKNYSSSHIMELLKHLHRPQKHFTLSLLGKTWTVSPLWLSPDEKTK